MKITLKKFDFSTLPKDGRIILVIGRRGSGKSTLIEDIMYNLRHRFDFAIGMSPTRSSIEMMERHMPDVMVFEEGFSKEQFQKMLSLSSIISRKGKLRSGLLCMDDCNSDKDAFRSKNMRDAFMNGRHYGMNILWAMHYCMDILPDLRSQVDYVFVLKDNIRKNKERLYQNFFGMLDKVEDFMKIMDQCTENNECLILDNTTPNPDPKTCLFWYKAKRSQPEFRLGKPVFYKLAEYYRKQSIGDDDDLLRVRIRPGHNMPLNGVPDIGFSNEANPRVECVEKKDK
jgi:hypothetical protein